MRQQFTNKEIISSSYHLCQRSRALRRVSNNESARFIQKGGERSRRIFSVAKATSAHIIVIHPRNSIGTAGTPTEDETSFKSS